MHSMWTKKELFDGQRVVESGSVEGGERERQRDSDRDRHAEKDRHRDREKHRETVRYRQRQRETQ